MPRALGRQDKTGFLPAKARVRWLEGARCNGVGRRLTDVVIVPDIQQHRRRRCAPCHHEAGEIGDVQLGLDVDARINHKPAKREEEPQRNKRKPPPRIIRRKRQHQQHHRARYIRRHSVQIRLHGAIPQPGDNLGQEEGDGLQRDAQAHFDGEDEPGAPMFENLDGFAELEFLFNDGGAVDLDAVEGQLLFFRGEEFGGGG